ncbi:MAG: SCO family protein [Bacteroidetes bacterium]|nr:SCO family protein [Bacteroidota bacterium]
MSQYKQRIAIVAMFVVPVAIYFWMKSHKPIILKLQIMGERYVDEKTKDTVFHQIPDFSFIDQHGKALTQTYFDSGATVVNFFYSTCDSICPRMNGNVLNIYEKYLGDPTIHFLSHTVDPEYDNSSILSQYAKNLNAKYHKWRFVTGNKNDIYKIAVEGYLLPTGYDEKMPTDSIKFFHSQNLLLIDNHHRIRGIYDALQSYDIKRLDDELTVLRYEILHEKDK